METQKTLDIESNLENEKQLEESGSDYTTKLESSDSMILSQKQKYRSMEQDRKPRNKPLHLSLLQVKGREIKCSLLQGMLSLDRTQVFLHCERILYHLNHQGSPMVNYSMTKEARLPNIGKTANKWCWENWIDVAAVWAVIKIICLQCRRHKRYGYYPWVRKIPWKRKW